MTDFETSLLDGWDKPIPKGDKRHENPEWAKHVQAQVYPHHSDVDWWEYCFWVELGYGDEWFIKSSILTTKIAKWLYNKPPH